MVDPKRDVSFWADQIAEHGYDKHVTKKEEFTKPIYGDDQGVTTKDQYRDHAIRNLTDNATQGFIGDNGRELYYNKQTNSASIINNLNVTESTHFRPENGEQWFIDNYKNEKSRLDDKGIEIGAIIQGGYPALHNEQAMSRSDVGKSDTASSATPVDLTKVDLPKYAAAEHGYKVTFTKLTFTVIKAAEPEQTLSAAQKSPSTNNDPDPTKPNWQKQPQAAPSPDEKAAAFAAALAAEKARLLQPREDMLERQRANQKGRGGRGD